MIITALFVSMYTQTPDMIMSRYESYSMEDFVLDAEFQNWVRFGNDLSVKFWNEYIVQSPSQADDIREARMLLQSVYQRYGADITEDEIETEIAGLIHRIRERGERRLLNPDPTHLEKRLLRPWLWFAAAMAMIVGGFTFWPLMRTGNNVRYEQLVAGKSLVEKTNNTSKPRTIRLEDGSTVVLKPGAKISVPSSFSAERREVYLTGEAYFTVSRDVARPFLVYTHRLVARVLGTSFIVSAPVNGSNAIVEVKEGKVSVFRKADFDEANVGHKTESKGIVVTPNQKITIEDDGLHMVKTLSETPEVVVGRKPVSRFDYKNTPVRNVLQDMKEAYQVDIIFDADLLSDCPITATLTTQPLLEKLNIICEAIEAKYEVLDGQIIIYGKSCLP